MKSKSADARTYPNISAAIVEDETRRLSLLNLPRLAIEHECVTGNGAETPRKTHINLVTSEDFRRFDAKLRRLLEAADREMLERYAHRTEPDYRLFSIIMVSYIIIILSFYWEVVHWIESHFFR